MKAVAVRLCWRVVFVVFVVVNVVVTNISKNRFRLTIIEMFGPFKISVEFKSIFVPKWGDIDDCGDNDNGDSDDWLIMMMVMTVMIMIMVIVMTDDYDDDDDCDDNDNGDSDD